MIHLGWENKNSLHGTQEEVDITTVRDAIVMKKLNLNEGMKELWAHIDTRIEKYGEMSEQDIQKEIESYRSSRKKLSK